MPICGKGSSPGQSSKPGAKLEARGKARSPGQRFEPGSKLEARVKDFRKVSGCGRVRRRVKGQNFFERVWHKSPVLKVPTKSPGFRKVSGG